jgi:hypothetical protein
MQSQQDGEVNNNFYSSGGVTTLEKAAQGGSGFQTYGLDLGVIGSRKNADDEINRQAASRGGFQQGSQTYQSSSSSYGSGTQSSISSGSSRSSSSHSSHHSSQNSQSDHDYNDNEYEDEEDFDLQEEQEQHSKTSSQQQQKTSNFNHLYSSNPSRTYSYTESNSRFQHYPQKRDTSSIQYEDPCPTMNCMRLRCVVGPLDKTSALIAFRTRVVAETLHKVIKFSLRFLEILKTLKLNFFSLCENRLVVKMKLNYLHSLLDRLRDYLTLQTRQRT